MTDATVLMMMGPVEMTIFYNNRGPSHHSTRDGTLFLVFDEPRDDVRAVRACNYKAVRPGIDILRDPLAVVDDPAAAVAVYRDGKLNLTMLLGDRPVDILFD